MSHGEEVAFGTSCPHCHGWFAGDHDIKACSRRDRESFCAMLDGSPLEQADAAVLLCGEDVGPRTAVAINLLASGAVPLIVASGGKHKPPRWHGAAALVAELYAKGVQPGRIITEADSQNTREQAVNVSRIAKAQGWSRLILVASNYHAPRAFLTFVKAMADEGMTETLRLMSAPARAPWQQSPEGMRSSRWQLRTAELQKIEDYRNHVASYADGIAYLTRWESA